MSSWSQGARPLTLAILALGGEGGGVLADWIVAVAEEQGCWAQNTSVAGVAQRTGATVYYIEIFTPTAAGEPAPDSPAPVRAEPVMSIFPTPGEVDVVIASELMECGRAIQRGFTTADRTTLITSTNRVYSIDERIAMGDGRVDDGELLAAAGRASKRLVAADFMAIAEQAGSVISASLFGAVSGSGVLPFPREAVRTGDPRRAARASRPHWPRSPPVSRRRERLSRPRRAPPPTRSPRNSPPPPACRWRRARRAAEGRKARREVERNEIAARDPGSLVGPALRGLAGHARDLPAQSRSMVLHGLVRTALYQDRDYAERYLSRVSRLAEVDPDGDGAARLTTESARHVALWMCYQDTIQVAVQKIRRGRLQRIRQESRAKSDQLVEVREYLHPQIEEITDTMPVWLGRAMLDSPIVGRAVHTLTNRGFTLNTTSVGGYTLLTTLALARPLRPRSLRFAREQEAIEGWIDRALQVGRTDPDLAREIIECQGVLKGYGATHEHGAESFGKLMSAADRLAGSADAAERLAALRSAALVDEHGGALEAQLSTIAVG